MRTQRFYQTGLMALAVLVLGAEALVAATAAGLPGHDEPARSQAEVMALDRHWMDAELDGDTAWLDAMLLPEYRSVGADGGASGKAAIMAHAAGNRGSDEQRRKVEAWLKSHPSGQSVTIRGGTAILTFFDPRLGPQKGVRSADIFVQVDGRWRALYSQHSAFRSD